MKWLKDDAYNALKTAADKWNGLVESVLSDNPDMQADEITPEQLLEAVLNGTDGNDEQQEQLIAAQGELAKRDATIASLNQTIQALKATPKSVAADPIVESEPSAEGDAGRALIAFAEKHEGDTAAVMEEVRKSDFFNIK